MTEENKIEAYFKNGGKLFSVVKIDRYRDGGTIGIEIRPNPGYNYYYTLDNKLVKGDIQNRKEWKELTDPNEIEYLINRINQLKQHLEAEITMCDNLIFNIK